MTKIKSCPKCGLTLPIDKFGWRNRSHTSRQGWCRPCLNRARTASKKRPGRDGVEHLRNHYETALSICGKVIGHKVAAHYYDEEPATLLPTCPTCLAIDERACLEADSAQHQPRGPLDTNPYRQTYLAVVYHLTHKE